MILIKKEKEKKERKKVGILILMDFLLKNNYPETLTVLESETTLNFEDFELADNIDLMNIIKDFEDFYEYKYDKKPLFYKKNFKIKTIKKPKSKIFSKKLPKMNKTSLYKFEKKKNKISKNNKENKENFSPNCDGLKITNKKQEQKTTTEDYLDNRVINFPSLLAKTEDDQKILKQLKNEIINKNLKINFKDIIGMENAKKVVKEAILLPLKLPELFTNKILEPWKGILLFGPPGTGKTMLAKAVASECKTTFFNISASSIVSKYHGESEKTIRLLFELARCNRPATIFIDEIDSIITKRGLSNEHEASRRLKTELLIQMDGLDFNDIFVMVASNNPWDLDSSFLRRIEKRVFLIRYLLIYLI